MAWQLVYTSAPRLLEAGRSGFGTVARHRQATPLLVSAVERSSQFARLPGMDAGRVVFNHRIIAAGGGRFHVLSCIRDAGADYTGRTNHLAHHLLIEPREAAQAMAAGITPSDVLLAAPWRDRWDEPPRFFEEDEEVAICRLPASGASEGRAWAHCTGQPANAWLLAAGEASRGAWIIVPAGADARLLFAESQRLAPDRAWQTTFTTSLQPNDEAADFSWIGVEPSSPLFPQTQRGSRPVLDLTDPASLPAPQVPAAPAPRSLPTPTALLSAPAPSRSMPPPAFVHPSSGAKSAVQKPRMPALNKAAGDLFSEKVASHAPKSSRKWILTASVAAVVAAGGFYVAEQIRDSRETARRQAEVVERAKASDAFTPETIAGLKSSIASIPPAKLPEAADFIRVSIETMRALDQPDFVAISGKTHATALQEKAASASLPSIPDEIRAAGELLDKAASMDYEHTHFPISADSSRAYDSDLTRQTGEIDDLLKRGPLPRARLAKVEALLNGHVKRDAVSALRKLLSGNIVPPDGEAWFRPRLAALSAVDPETKATADRLSNLLDDWHKGIGKIKKWPHKTTPEDRKEFSWLFAATSGHEPEPPDAVETAPPPSAEKKSDTALYFSDTKLQAGRLAIAELADPLDFELHLSDGSVTKLAFNSGGIVRKSAQSQQDGFKISNGSLVPEDKAPIEPFAVIGCNKATGAAVFALRIGWPASGEPIFGHVKGGLRLQNEVLAIDLASTALQGNVQEALWLELPPSFDGHSTAPRAEALDHGKLNLAAEIKAARDSAKTRDDQFKFAQKALADFDSHGLNVKSLVELLEKQRKFSKQVVDGFFTEAQKLPAPQACDKLLKGIGTDWGTGWSNTDFAKAEDVFKAGEKLTTAKTPVEIDLAAATALNNIRAVRLKAKTKEQVEGPGAMLALMETTIMSLGTSARPRLVKNLEQAKAAAEAAKATPLFGARLPVGAYRLLVETADGVKIPLVQFDVF